MALAPPPPRCSRCLVLILLIMRPMSSAGAAIATLLVGVTWMMGVAGLFGVRITFLNFIALPITFGIGAEYGLNVAVRYREDRDMIHAVMFHRRRRGGLLVDHHRGLRLAASPHATGLCKALAPWPSWANWLASAQRSWPCLA